MMVTGEISDFKFEKTSVKVLMFREMKGISVKISGRQYNPNEISVDGADFLLKKSFEEDFLNYQRDCKNASRRSTSIKFFARERKL